MSRWIAADWGTTHLRVWVMDGDAVSQTLSSDDGMGGLAPDAFEPALLDLVAPHLDDGATTTVIACGMVGARQGWCEARYAPVPAPPPGIARAVTAPARDARIAVQILPGMSQASPADVMRGEETQIAGFIATHPGWDGVLCLPGTHTKWAHVSAGEVVSFRTFMTGELFAMIAGQSVLRHSIGPGWDDAAFETALGETISRPERVSGALFALRAEGLLGALDPGSARARLSGMLIGQELAAARPYWLGQRVALIGAGEVMRPYAAALGAQGAAAEAVDGGAMTLRGLIAAHHAMQQEMSR